MIQEYTLETHIKIVTHARNARQGFNARIHAGNVQKGFDETCIKLLRTTRRDRFYWTSTGLRKHASGWRAGAIIGVLGARKRLSDSTLLRPRPRAPLYARTGSLTPRTCVGNFDSTNYLNTSIDAVKETFSDSMLRALLGASVCSLSRSWLRALFVHWFGFWCKVRALKYWAWRRYLADTKLSIIRSI